ncbi:23S rRNA m2A2503 methyltransferase [Halobacteroides halobius DSM 5150]|uniref:Probable dual-specificity RNA methyltransferase RlmN n=1 Tax=Halobacteroides halobius (strain ATCC 35273 / DSM 5150 / MD-1) TaxID=748449 RepID=L0K6H7_HALHC|nr:23S rRNA (adenine(2503)-C(2))-methyltransferase RlmN [Halobacteroides halobius]AGB40852.1 23S rRNA m2A2503 methyltransferase [Halobacteroides halobius DSM 5150]
MVEKINLLGKSINELEEIIKELGEASFRAKQIFSWLYDKKVNEFNQMTNLSKNLRNKLAKKTTIGKLELIASQESADGTEKYLFELEDGKKIETVYLPVQEGRKSICISTQVGCAMGCNFCATGLQGLSRNLTTGEIVNQILEVERIKETKITNVVLMGMGEPLANYKQVLKALELINHDLGLNIGMRKVTLSTCGLVPEIRRLAEEKLQLTLAISLHAPNNQLRSKMMPVNDRYPIHDLMEACVYYIQQTNRRVTFEYALVAGVNDSRKHAQQLATLLADKLVHVNLIPINKVEKLSYSNPSNKAIKQFKEELDNQGIPVSIRTERGADIDAACGQLQAKED